MSHTLLKSIIFPISRSYWKFYCFWQTNNSRWIFKVSKTYFSYFLFSLWTWHGAVFHKYQELFWSPCLLCSTCYFNCILPIKKIIFLYWFDHWFYNSLPIWPFYSTRMYCIVLKADGLNGLYWYNRSLTCQFNRKCLPKVWTIVVIYNFLGFFSLDKYFVTHRSLIVKNKIEGYVIR